ncbi:hypothetical protein CO112_03355 [Candidatus Dojkabacteria bacterium CG_4_9_14_3_um_filter_150_Dojkabacteria_WS6_41_13]|uniref:Dihydroorotate dehydrogenase (quinone) n=1 Tax=Candidatus Dojkabacteria bacterium CG_4_10_14_0_2_um_filter_Dojkabacteria_WS6_41_15 TaxID=2014249 RepID=A0A2M7W0X3_9BACT|nr:MAG: hypothetical protein COZ14_00085 [Candidatus Dojkabacteria bacterium CG_4_10_14_3_um_filter_Dojkabacteria_WS6_41_9]PJA12251.1 MAG: hypothetical protein COX64_04755 [Candidatus Dojkabacteria bacterium CG_4_10_14_0_2_um_filter_Dojkabacteria_WS6_41_15]PJB22653.1 MAG: hypothetical protein CO112_03355 [Candidatus Dojkabacteria bacterium CG_4_9_14_3_um_filter_150_Dojkabacteria_WS6_41_13]
MRQLFAFLYKNLLKPILYLIDPEVVHNHFTSFGEFLGSFAFTKAITRGIYGYKGTDISKTVDGIIYKTPVLLSAGFDYNAHLPTILQSMGFGGEEVGSITLRAYEGNEKPRLRRAIKSKSLIIWKGLKNEGVDVIIERLKQKQSNIPRDFVVGISIARTNDVNLIDDEAGYADYVGSYKKLLASKVGDYYTLNVSCPNAKGGESFAEESRLTVLLSRICQIRDEKPIYVKLPINKPWDEFKKLLDVCLQYQVQGVIIGNLNKDYNSLDYREEAPKEFRGGLSGKPCRELSTTLIRKTREYVGQSFTIIGVGGILSPADALEKLDAGADLLMLITGMIMEGPHLVSDINDAIAKRQESAK